MDPHKRHLKKLKRLQDLRKQKLKEKEKVKQKKKSKKSDQPTTKLEEEKSEILDVSVEKIEGQSNKTGNESS